MDARATVEIVIPVYNEERDLPRSIDVLAKFLKDNLENPWRITIVDNGSTDNTLSIAEMLSGKYPGLTAVRIPQKGRGRALRHVWMESTADILSYMDVDLSTDLIHFPQLVMAIEEGSDIVIGSRLSKGSKVQRSLKRELISRTYSALIRLMFFTQFKDAQCGFKGITRNAARAIIPLVKNNNWFFDTELLIIGGWKGFSIKEIPVHWVDDPDTRVKILRTAWEDLRGLLRLRTSRIPTLPNEETGNPDPK